MHSLALVLWIKMDKDEAEDGSPSSEDEAEEGKERRRKRKRIKDKKPTARQIDCQSALIFQLFVNSEFVINDNLRSKISGRRRSRPLFSEWTTVNNGQSLLGIVLINLTTGK